MGNSTTPVAQGQPDSPKDISVLMEDAINALYSREDYSDRCKKYIRSTWNQFLAYCITNGYKVYLPEYKDSFISDFSKRTPPFKQSTVVSRTRNMKMLDLYVTNGTWTKGNLDPEFPFLKEFKEFMEAQDNRLKKYGYSEVTCICIHRQTSIILRLFQSEGLTKMNDIDSSHISLYIMSLKGHAKSSLRGELSGLRVILRNAYLLEYTKEDLSVQVPRFKLGQAQSKIKIWNSEEINKVLDTVDRSSPTGKRDAAFIIIASELGMRSKDICNLKLSDIDWEACSISFSQSKVRNANVLPLNEKVGQAIIDYLHVRPQTQCDYLFVKMAPPHEKMKSFNTAFQRYVHRSGVEVPRESHYGLHSHRATVITRLLEAGVSADVAFAFAGHSDRESLPNYVRLDIEHLRECALSFEDGELI